MATEFVSGSWDGTAKIWDVETGQVKSTLAGHTHATTVLTLPNGITITGSQDKKIRLWYNGKQEREFLAHDDIVRGFVEVPQLNAFASCSNDETVKLWSLDGTHLMDFRGHQGFVFAVDCLETGEIVSGGDDCTVRVWKDGACKQTVQMPRTVWTVTHNKFGDLIVGCEDKTIRTFTRDHSRRDDGPDLVQYQEDCKSGAQSQSGPDMSTLLEFKAQVEGKVFGKSEGEIKVFKDNNVAKAYMWRIADHKWEEIGEVINPEQAKSGNAGPPQGTKYYEGDNLFQSGEYDHVFDVDPGDGVMRKLPFNNGAPFLEAADKFCSREGISRVNVEQIVQFLRAHALPTKTRDFDGSEAQAAQKVIKPTCSSIPFTQHLFFEAAKLDGAKKKILEFNTELGNILDEKDLQHLETLTALLNQTQYYHSSQVSPQ